MQGKQFTVAFLTWQHQLSLTSVYKYPRSPGKKGKITPVDLQPKQKKQKTKNPPNKLQYKYSVPGVLISALNY